MTKNTDFIHVLIPGKKVNVQKHTYCETKGEKKRRCEVNIQRDRGSETRKREGMKGGQGATKDIGRHIENHEDKRDTKREKGIEIEDNDKGTIWRKSR